MTLCQLYAKQNAQRANVKKSTQKQREQLMRLLKEDKLGARSIDTIKPSDAKEWAKSGDLHSAGVPPVTLRAERRVAKFRVLLKDKPSPVNGFSFDKIYTINE